VAEGDLAAVGDEVQVPEAGRVRFLVQARLPREGTPQVDFRLAGAGASLAGHLERTVSYARVGRGSRAAVTHDHTATWLHGVLPVGGGAVSLERLRGEVAGPLHLAAYGDGLPGWALVALAALALSLAGAAEARLGGGSTAPAVGMTVAFGLIVVGWATPGAAVGTALVAFMLGGMGGAIAGGLFAWVAKGVVPAAPPPTPIQPARKPGGRGGKGGGPAKAA
jgi:hypothetical protein